MLRIFYLNFHFSPLPRNQVEEIIICNVIELFVPAHAYLHSPVAQHYETKVNTGVINVAVSYAVILAQNEFQFIDWIQVQIYSLNLLGNKLR